MKKFIIPIFTLFVISCFFSCGENVLCPEITIPEIDTIPPNYTFNINGPGIGQTISTQEEWTGGVLTLLAGGRYNFVLSASDQGGTRLLRMQIPIDLTIQQLRPENATSRDIGAFAKILELTNNDESPTSCLIMNGQFITTENSEISARVDFLASDYGGTAGSRNSTTRRVIVNFTDDVGSVGFSDF